MFYKVRTYVKRWNMIEENDRLIVGVSGGADSICLLFILIELQKEISFDIVVVHVNHGLRGEEADADESYVKHICQENDLPFVAYFKNVELTAKKRKQSTEEAGRNIRRACFEKTKREYQGTKIVLAHHQNDNVETLLMNLSRGTGLKGLGGIAPVAGNIIRPLLCVNRKEIEEYLLKKEIAYCIDTSNAEDCYTRNRIRNHVVPYLEKEINTRVISHINDTMEQMRDIQLFLEQQVNFYVQQCVKAEEDRYIVLERIFESVPEVLKPMLLKNVLVEVSKKEKDLQSIHVASLQELFQKQVGRRIDLPYDIEGRRIYTGICLQKKKKKVDYEYSYYVDLKREEEKQIILNGKTIICKVFGKTFLNMKHLEKNNTKWFDYDTIKSGFEIRTRRAGDYITIHPDGRTQKLKSYFINEKIPQEQRDRILLVADGSHILWVEGYRTNCMYQVTEKTKNILEIQMSEGENYGRNN